MGKLTRPQDALPIDPDEFTRLLKLAEQAGVGQMSSPFPDTEGYEEWQFQPTDGPVHRSIVAIGAFYKDDPDKFFSAMCRVFGFISIVQHPRLSKWVYSSTPFTRVHDAVIEAAASAEMDENAEFVIEPFLDLVQRTLSIMSS